MDEDLGRVSTKLIILLQCSLELMDELKNTDLYRQDIKYAINNLERKLESSLRKPLSTIDDVDEKEDTFMGIQRGVQKMLEASLEEIYILQE